MEKYINVLVRGIAKKDLKNVLLDSGLSKMFLKNKFFDGKVYVDVKEQPPYGEKWNYSLNISAENINQAAEIYRSILEKSEGKIFGTFSSSYTEKENRISYPDVKKLIRKLDLIESLREKKVYSGTGTGRGVFL